MSGRGFMDRLFDMPDCSCPVCGEQITVFGPIPWLTAQGMFCSAACGEASRKAKKEEAMIVPMTLPPCPDCGAEYDPGSIGTLHDPGCGTLPENRAKRDNLIGLFHAMHQHPFGHEAINWDAFAEAADKVGLHYHPGLGLMAKEQWEAVKPFVKEMGAT